MKWEKALAKLKKKPKEEGALKLTKEKLVTKVRKTIGVINKKIDEAIDKLYN